MSGEPPTPAAPVRRPPPRGAPPPGVPVITWSERGLATGTAPRPGPTWLEDLVGGAFLLAWRALGMALLPWLLLHPRARHHILGLARPPPGWTWLHGASAGEHVAARALAGVLGPEVWRTRSSWRTPVRGTFPAPLDLPFVVGPWLDRARPGLLILVEAELWPGWLWHCRRRGIPVAVVNARPGRGTSRWRRLGPLWRWLTREVHFVSQEETGDLKLSVELQAAVFDLEREAFIAASTREGDEARVLAAWQQLPEPRPLLVLAPRHLSRQPEVELLLQQTRVRWRRRSDGVQGSFAQTDVLLLDTMGELSTLYSQAKAAFVGGTFDPAIGGHSPAEPFAAGLPVVSGPHQHSNPVAWTSGFALTVGASRPEQITAQLAAAMQSALRVGPQPAADNEAAARAAALLPEPVLPAERPLRPWLWPVVPLLQAAGRARRAWRGQPLRAGVPVVCIGALAAGGVGKTPAVAWLAAALQERLGPEAVWVVARGYRRNTRGPAVRSALPGAAWEPGYLGDELEMLRRRGICVISAPDRVAGAREAARLGARVVLLDDGFQHRRLHRDLDVVCIDALRPEAGGPLPVGERREPWSGLARADWIWESHGAAPPLRPGRRAVPPAPIELPLATELPRVQARTRPLGWLSGGALQPLDSVRGEVDVAVGIAHSERFVGSLLGLGLELHSLRRVRDHGELGRLPPGCVITEKDAARLPEDAPVRALVQELEVHGADALVQAILERVG